MEKDETYDQNDRTSEESLEVLKILIKSVDGELEVFSTESGKLGFHYKDQEVIYSPEEWVDLDEKRSEMIDLQERILKEMNHQNALHEREIEQGKVENNWQGLYEHLVAKMFDIQERIEGRIAFHHERVESALQVENHTQMMISQQLVNEYGEIRAWLQS
jgi:hypothetical protein